MDDVTKCSKRLNLQRALKVNHWQLAHCWELSWQSEMLVFVAWFVACICCMIYCRPFCPKVKTKWEFCYVILRMALFFKRHVLNFEITFVPFCTSQNCESWEIKIPRWHYNQSRGNETDNSGKIESFQIKIIILVYLSLICKFPLFCTYHFSIYKHKEVELKLRHDNKIFDQALF